MDAQRQHRSRMILLVRMFLFMAVPGIRGLLSVQSLVRARRSAPMCFSTALFSEATLLPPKKTKTALSSDSSTRKRLGKSSFLYKQKTTNKDDITAAASAVSSATDLRLMAEKHSGKTIGSFQHKKAWTRWLYLAVESIREDLGEHLLLLAEPSEDDEEEKEVREAFEKLFFDLGVAADEGTMPSFESGAARKGYALEFFCRGRALAELFLETPLFEAAALEGDSDEGVYPGFWTQALRSQECPILAASKPHKVRSLEEPVPPEAPSTYEIVSLGGGPGFDFVGVALAAAFSFHTTTSIVSDSTTANTLPFPGIHVTAMDYEEGWSDLVSAMDRSTRNLLNPLLLTDDDDESFASKVPAMSCDWGGKCDITKSILHEPVNANCKRLLLGGNDREGASRLWICQYCVAENAKALRESDYIFLKELVREMPKGSLVLLTEVVPRLWPEMVRMLHKEDLLSLVDVGFRKGYRGKQFLLKKRGKRRPQKGIASGHEDHRKRGGPFETLDERTRDQLEHFERLASYHDRKVDAGWKRQGRKDNGSAAYHEEQLRRRRNRPEEE